MALTAQQQALLGDLLDPAQQAALDRLMNYYDGERPYDPIANPGGFRRGGQVINFDPALQDAAIVLLALGVISADVTSQSDEVQQVIAQALAAYGSVNALTEAITLAQLARQGAAGAAQSASTALTAAASSASAASTSAASAAVSAAAASTKALNYDTLAQLNADLSPPANQGANVNADGANNGFYVKAGASGTGSWARKSTATLPGLAAATSYLSVAGLVPGTDKISLLGSIFRAAQDARVSWQDARGFASPVSDPLFGSAIGPGSFGRSRADGAVLGSDSRGFSISQRHERHGWSIGDGAFARGMLPSRVSLGDARGFSADTIHERLGHGAGGVYARPTASGTVEFLDSSGFAFAVWDPDAGLIAPRSRDAERSSIVRSRDGEARMAWVDDARRAWTAPRIAPDVGNVAAAYISGAAGSRRVSLALGANEYAVSSPPSGQEDVVLDRITPSLIRYVRRQSSGGGLVGVLEDDLAPYSSHASTVTSLTHVPSIGQSLNAAISYNALNTAPLRPGRGLMFNGGPRPMGGVPDYSVLTSAATKLTPPGNMVGFQDLYERIEDVYGETYGSRMVDAMLAGMPASAAILSSIHGLGGASLAQISKGTAPYANLIEAIRRARLMAALLGLSYSLPCVVHQQGNSDYVSAAGIYRAALAAQQANIQADVNALWGRAGTLPLLCSQPSSWTASGLAVSDLPNEILQAALASGGAIMASHAEYLLPYLPDGAHPTAIGQQLSGEYFARAIGKLLAGQGQSALALYAVSATRSGANITVTFNVPVAPIVLDTSYVTDPGNYGFSFRQAGGSVNSPSILGVTVASTNQITIQMSAVPTGNSQFVDIGMVAANNSKPGPKTGPRCCLRDSANDGVRTPNAPFSMLRNYALHQTIAIS